VKAYYRVLVRRLNGEGTLALIIGPSGATAFFSRSPQSQTTLGSYLGHDLRLGALPRLHWPDLLQGPSTSLHCMQPAGLVTPPLGTTPCSTSPSLAFHDDSPAKLTLELSVMLFDLDTGDRLQSIHFSQTPAEAALSSLEQTGHTSMNAASQKQS
jgi:hypothetical protein